MAIESFLHDVRSLVWQAAKTQLKIEGFFGIRSGLALEATNLHRAIRRLQQEAIKDQSPLNSRGDVRRKEFDSIADDCKKILQECDIFRMEYKPPRQSGKSLRSPVGDQLKAMLDKFQSQLMASTSSICYITVRVSIDSMGSEKDHLTAVGEVHALKFGVTRITSNLMASGDISSSETTRYAIKDGTM